MIRLTTKLDKLLDLLLKFGELTLDDAATRVKIDMDLLEDFFEYLERKGVVELIYPIFPWANPVVRIKHIARFEKEKKPQGKIIEKYEFKSPDDMYKGIVEILEFNGEKKYYLHIPKVKPLTREFLDYVKEKIAEELPIETFMMSEKERKHLILDKQYILSRRYIEKITSDPRVQYLLIGIIRAEIYELQFLTYFLHDNELEEIVINDASTPIFVYHRKYGWMETNMRMEREYFTLTLVNRIARRVGKNVTWLTPILDAHLVSGERVNATAYPIAIKGNSMTIRKLSTTPYTILQLIENHTLSIEMAALLWQAIEYGMNIIISGGTASGKTTTLNALMLCMDKNQRIITVEDTRELYLPEEFKNSVYMVTREENIEGVGKVTLYDLLVNALRMRPDRMVIGEVRRKDEVMVMAEAMHTGHPTYTTFHSDTAYVAVRRLTTEPINLPVAELDNVDFIVVQRLDKKRGVRRMYEIVSISAAEEEFQLKQVFHHNIRNDIFEFHELPLEYREKLYLYSGMSDEEINNDLKTRKQVLKYMIKKKLDTVDKFVKTLIMLREEPEKVLKTIKKGGKPWWLS